MSFVLTSAHRPDNSVSSKDGNVNTLSRAALVKLGLEIENVMEPNLDFEIIRNILCNGNWADLKYSPCKAAVSAFFAKAAYLHIPQYEVDSKHRTKLIPCYEHERMRRIRKAYDVREFLARGEFGETFVIETELTISVITKNPKVTFVATRGTQTFGDMWVDVKALTKTVTIDDIDYKFHRGFFQLARELVDEITRAIRCGGDEQLSGPVYFVGHSLGGALSANMRLLCQLQSLCNGQAYLFASPRYCDSRVLQKFGYPHTVANPKDVIPNVPWGYAKYPVSKTIGSAKPRLPIPIWNRSHQHAVEHYCSELNLAANLP